ncbi:actin cortical patch SUR7/pH-response regulator pali [Cadophora sp. MPI-SDFR-AT-0126]|nr:actin cortical patch SUR7/pH-response regulator pali [Leotiomycetes sp. MPI-SDFR-AT-0126]
MVSEKAASVKRKADKIVLNRKFAPFVTLLTAIVAFSLSLVALLAVGSSDLQKYDLLTLNTSTLFQNAIKVSNTDSSTRRSVPILDEDSIPMPQMTDRAMLPTPVQARQLPSPSDIESFFSSIGSGFTSAVNPATPSATGSTGSGSTGGSGSGGFLQDLEGLFQSLLGAATGAAGQEIVDVVNRLIAEVLDALGIDDYYSLYMREYCSGSYTPNYSSPNAKKKNAKCTPFDEALPDIPKTNSTLQIGTTVIDFSALNLPNKLSSATGGIDTVFTAIFAIQVTGIVASGILIVVTPLHIFFSFFQRFIFRLAIAALASIATACFGATAGIETGIMVIINVLVNGLGEGLGIESQTGGDFLALLWVSFVFMSISTTVWFLKWHKDRYVRRPKEDYAVERPMVKSATSTYELGDTERVSATISSDSGRRVI